MDWITQNISNLVDILTKVIAVAAAVAAMTKTPSDDGVMAKVRKVIDFLALNVANAKNSSDK